jgi:hypothetical protein
LKKSEKYSNQEGGEEEEEEGVKEEPVEEKQFNKTMVKDGNTIANMTSLETINYKNKAMISELAKRMSRQMGSITINTINNTNKNSNNNNNSIKNLNDINSIGAVPKKNNDDGGYLSHEQLNSMSRSRNFFMRIWYKFFDKQSKFRQSSYYKNNLSWLFAILIYMIVQIVLVTVQWILYKDSNIFLITARLAGILLNFNSCLIIVIVLRRLWTWMRSTIVGRMFLPIDEFINFHKRLGVWILILSLIHTFAHCINLCKWKCYDVTCYHNDCNNNSFFNY